MKQVTVNGKTVDEAIQKALEMLGALREEVSIEVITHEKKGVLGFGATEAEVKVTLNNTPVQRGEAYLCQLLNGMGVEDYDVSVTSEDDTVTYSVTGEGDVGFIIGYHGDVLDALSSIVSLAVNKDSDVHYRVNVDLNGYREKRIESLKEYAQRAIAKATESGYVTVANPMKPFERMILHTEVQESMDVVSWSEGEEPRRRVIIAPLSKVKKVDDHYERIDRHDERRDGGRGDFRDRDDRRGGRGDFRGRDDRRGGGRGGRGGRDSRDRAPKYVPDAPNRPAKSDFTGSLYGKIEVKKDSEGSEE